MGSIGGSVNQRLNRVEEQMTAICQQHYNDELTLLQTIPGIKQQSAMQIIAETGGDMNAFERAVRWSTGQDSDPATMKAQAK
jgi:transposase